MQTRFPHLIEMGVDLLTKGLEEVSSRDVG